MLENRNNELYEINHLLDDLRPLFYKVLEFPKDSNSDAKDLAKRELRFAIQDLLNQAELL